MRVTYVSLALALVVFTAYFYISIRDVGLREYTLYQGYYPVNETTSGLLPGDAILIDPTRASGFVTLNPICAAANKPIIARVREHQLISMRGVKSFPEEWREGDSDVGGFTVRQSMEYVNIPKLLDNLFSDYPACEEILHEKTRDMCLMIVRSVIMIADIPIGFDTSDRCQIIGTTAIELASDSASIRFDRAFGVSAFERFVVENTRQLVNPYVERITGNLPQI